MISKNLHKLARILKEAILSPSMEGLREDYHVPWELVTEIQKIIDQATGLNFPLKWHKIKDENPLPSEVKNTNRIPEHIDSLSDEQIRYYSAIHRIAFHPNPEYRNIMINLYAGLEFNGPLLIFWVYAAGDDRFYGVNLQRPEIRKKVEDIAMHYNLDEQMFEAVYTPTTGGFYYRWEIPKRF